MKINPRIAVAAVVATGAIVGGGIAAFTAMSPGHPAGTVEAAPINAGDGQKAFRAIVFGQGNYAKALGEKTDTASFYASGYASHNTAASVAAADRIVDDIASSDPRYFTNFDQQVRSGNPFTVATAIGGISERLRHSGVVSARDDAEPPGWYSNFHINQKRLRQYQCRCK